MNNNVAILDDESDRIRAMVPILNQRFPDLNVVTFENAPDINQWFAENLESCRLICLDHDLGPNQRRDGVVFDPGIGRDVADYLATRNPVCPIIIHTTNTIARPGMIRVLEEAQWIVTYVSPYSDVKWIGEVWIQEVIGTMSNA